MNTQDCQLYYQNLEKSVATKEKTKLVIRQIKELGEDFLFPHSDQYLELYEEYNNLFKQMESLPRLPFDPFSADAYDIMIEEELNSRRSQAIEWAKENKIKIPNLAKQKLKPFNFVDTQVNQAEKLKLIEKDLDNLDSLTVLDAILAALKIQLQLPSKFVLWLEKKMLSLKCEKKPSFSSEKSFGKLPKRNSTEILLVDGTAFKIFTILVEAHNNPEIKLSKHGIPRNPGVQQTYDYISKEMKSRYKITCKPGQVKAILDITNKKRQAKNLYLLAKSSYELGQDLVF